MGLILLVINIIITILLIKVLLRNFRLNKSKKIELATDEEVINFFIQLVTQIKVKQSNNISGHIFEVKVGIAYTDMFMINIISLSKIFNFKLKELYETDSIVKLELLWDLNNPKISDIRVLDGTTGLKPL